MELLSGQPRRSALLPALGGFLLTLPPLWVTSRLPSPLALEGLTVLLAGVASVYIGFALVDGRRRSLALELPFAALILGLALAGLWWHPWALAFGFVLHGAWDMLHHWRRPVITTQVPWWYAFSCLTFDLPVAVYVFWRWA